VSMFVNKETTYLLTYLYGCGSCISTVAKFYST